MSNNDKYNKIIDNLTNSFVNDYDFWKNIIKNTNEALEIQDPKEPKEYTYDEFCSTFIKHVKTLNEDKIFSQEMIQAILLKMIHEK